MTEPAAGSIPHHYPLSVRSSGLMTAIGLLMRSLPYAQGDLFLQPRDRRGNPWPTAQDGVVYYAQNAKPILKQAVWIVVLDYALSALLWLVLLIPAAALVAMLPASVREVGGVVTMLVAVLLALAARGAFVKPVFLIMIMTRFHALIEHEAINSEWVTRLDQISVRFRTLGEQAAAFAPGLPAASPATRVEMGIGKTAGQ